jgi:hypothetical protein
MSLHRTQQQSQFGKSTPPEFLHTVFGAIHTLSNLRKRQAFKISRENNITIFWRQLFQSIGQDQCVFLSAKMRTGRFFSRQKGRIEAITGTVEFDLELFLQRDLTTCRSDIVPNLIGNSRGKNLPQPCGQLFLSCSTKFRKNLKRPDKRLLDDVRFTNFFLEPTAHLNASQNCQVVSKTFEQFTKDKGITVFRLLDSQPPRCVHKIASYSILTMFSPVDVKY